MILRMRQVILFEYRAQNWTALNRERKGQLPFICLICEEVMYPIGESSTASLSEENFGRSAILTIGKVVEASFTKSAICDIEMNNFIWRLGVP